MASHAHKHYGADSVFKAKMPEPNADMNITPMIDVLSQKGLDINLPPETNQPQQNNPISQIVLEYTADKKISINHQDVQLPELEERLRTIFEDRKDKTMFISGDGALRYGDIINVIDAAKGAGVEKVGIVTEGMRKGAGATPGA